MRNNNTLGCSLNQLKNKIMNEQNKSKRKTTNAFK